MRRSRRHVELPTDHDWAAYLGRFHARRPGITEDILSQARSAVGLTPYEWVVAPLPIGTRVLDIACGSGPCLALRRGEPWVGLDRSVEEVDRARRSGAVRLVLGDATSLPFHGDSFDGAVCSMAMMLVQPLDRFIHEISRVLRDGAPFVFTMPGRWPLHTRDVVRYARLVRCFGLGRLGYPNDRDLRGLASMLDEHELDIIDDARERFSHVLSTRTETDQFVQSLYLPEVGKIEVARGLALAATWVGSDIGIPLRRVTVQKRARRS